MGQPAKTPAELRAAALARFDKKVVRLEDVAVTLTKLLGRIVDQLKEHCFEGMGYKEGAPLDEKTVKLLKEVTAAFNSASDAQVRLDKTSNIRAKQMTHDERKAAVADFILTLPTKERSEWIVELIRRHDELKALGVGQSPGGRPLRTMPHVQGVIREAEGDDEAQ